MQEINIKLKENLEGVKSEVRKRTIGYIVTAFGLVAGLAWNDAIKSSIEYIFPQDKNNAQAKVIYAIIITLIVAIVSYYLTKLSTKEEIKKVELKSESKVDPAQKK